MEMFMPELAKTFKQKKSVLMIGNLTAFILFLAFFMVLSFSGIASAEYTEK